jgi:hypothetical protein
MDNNYNLECDSEKYDIYPKNEVRTVFESTYRHSPFQFDFTAECMSCSLMSPKSFPISEEIIITGETDHSSVQPNDFHTSP